MDIKEVCEKLQNKLNENFESGTFSVGHDEKDTIFIHEHKRGFAKQRVRPAWIPEEFKVIYKYIGKISPL